MANKEDFKRIERDDDPNRCMHVIQSSGQCTNKAYPGSKFCLAHGGNKAASAAAAKGLRNYRIQRYLSLLCNLRNSSYLKDLRDEIAILRMILEEKLNQIENSNELALQSGAISDLVIKIDKVVTSCQRLEERTGIMLDKNRIIQIAEQLITIVTNHVTDEAIIIDIADEFDKIFNTDIV